jgi:hypothetical protein
MDVSRSEVPVAAGAETRRSESSGCQWGSCRDARTLWSMSECSSVILARKPSWRTARGE